MENKMDKMDRIALSIIVALLLGSLFCLLGLREITNEGFNVINKKNSVTYSKELENYNSRFSTRSSENLWRLMPSKTVGNFYQTTNNTRYQSL